MSYDNEPSSALHSSKPNALIATKFESHINSGLFFITLNGSLFLVVGALATRYHTTLYIGALAAILSVFLGSTLLLLHKVMDSSLPKSSPPSDGSDTSSIVKGSNVTENGGTGWRDRLHQNLWDGVYPPNQKMGSVLSMVLIVILWMISTAITIEYHILIGRGEKPKTEIRQGPLSSYGELSFSCLCTALSFVLVITMVIQRRLTSKEMCKAISSQVNARPWPPVDTEE
ncbi:hypothetical protein BKA70DRAFT_1579400 [Coprinopsis sp. MPI-PUGE-AT-0042]|nr:hypothetical protein BKA70DRAFT_1579400 [Coprinopsis sp. MPI-PUGE-AT-0042]